MNGNCDHEVIIVGTGFGGMGAAIQLKRMGIKDILMVDRADDLGGTWHVNTYPGLAVDIPSTTYSYSFEPNPYWSRAYAPGAELKAYAVHVAEKYKLRRLMQFNSSVEKCVYDERARTWTVHVEGRKPVSGKILILATGFLSQPKNPDIEGLGSFAGKIIHTAKWDHSYDFRGKRAAMIGTGATAVQLLPKLVPQVAHMDVYQRTPIWVFPKYDPKIPPRVRKLFAAVPATQRALRYVTNTALEVGVVIGVLHNKEAPFLTENGEKACLAHLRRQVKDPVLREKLTPKYNLGCKRPTFANDYYPMFSRENVELVTDSIDCIKPKGIMTKDGKLRDIDALVLATGYKVWEKGNFPAFEVYGKDGVELGQWWGENGYQSYEGIACKGYPNMFYLAAPYAFTGLSYFFTIEGQMNHMARCLGEMKRKRADTFEVKDAAQSRFMKKMDKNMQSSLLVNGNCGPANSYYFNKNGESTLLRPESTAIALRRSSRFELRDYRFA